MILYPNKYCVYGHYVDDKLIYVGFGVSSRPFARANRSVEWAETAANGYDVYIFDWFDSAKEASIVESQLIKRYAPQCNKIHNGWVNPASVGNTWNLGKRHSEESKRIMSAKQKESWLLTKRTTGRRRPTKPIKCLETGIVYDGLRDAARQTGVHYTCISQCINGHRKAVGGLRFVRLEG